MRTLHKYIAGSFALTFSVTIIVITFVMTIGVAFRVTDLLARGVSMSLIGELLLFGVPPAMSFSIPMSVLTTCLLVFGRLSADGEITAMKSSGLSTWQIISTLLLLSLFLSAICLYINNELAPESHYRRKNLSASSVLVDAPIRLLDSGRFINFPEFTMFIGDKNETELLNVRIYQREKGKRKELRAERASVSLSENGRDLILTMRDVRIDPVVDNKRIFIGEMEFPVKDVFKSSRRGKREKDMTLHELWVMMTQPDEWYFGVEPAKIPEKRMSFQVEFNKRLVLSVSCFAFVMIGIPLGIKTHRKESSIGIGISLLLVTMFYIFILVGESLAEHPAMRPDLILWLPVVISIVLGSWLVRRGN